MFCLLALYLSCKESDHHREVKTSEIFESWKILLSFSTRNLPRRRFAQDCVLLLKEIQPALTCLWLWPGLKGLGCCKTIWQLILTRSHISPASLLIICLTFQVSRERMFWHETRSNRSMLCHARPCQAAIPCYQFYRVCFYSSDNDQMSREFVKILKLLCNKNWPAGNSNNSDR